MAAGFLAAAMAAVESLLGASVLGASVLGASAMGASVLGASVTGAVGVVVVVGASSNRCLAGTDSGVTSGVAGVTAAAVAFLALGLCL